MHALVRHLLQYINQYKHILFKVLSLMYYFQCISFNAFPLMYSLWCILFYVFSWRCSPKCLLLMEFSLMNYIQVILQGIFFNVFSSRYYLWHISLLHDKYHIHMHELYLNSNNNNNVLYWSIVFKYWDNKRLNMLRICNTHAVNNMN